MRISKFDLNSIIEMVKSCSQQAIISHGEFHFVISGGRSPISFLDELVKLDLDFNKWFVMLADERLNILDTNASSIYPYINKMGCNIIELEEHNVNNFRIDFALLGVGEDGHVASLFPQNFLKDSNDLKSVIKINNSPKPPAHRISLSYKKLEMSLEIIFLILGDEKSYLLNNTSRDIPLNYFKNLPQTTIFSDRI